MIVRVNDVVREPRMIGILRHSGSRIAGGLQLHALLLVPSLPPSGSAPARSRCSLRCRRGTRAAALPCTGVGDGAIPVRHHRCVREQLGGGGDIGALTRRCPCERQPFLRGGGAALEQRTYLIPANGFPHWHSATPPVWRWRTTILSPDRREGRQGHRGTRTSAAARRPRF